MPLCHGCVVPLQEAGWSLFLNDKKNRIEKERYVIQKGFTAQTIPTPTPQKKERKKKVMKHSNFQLFVVV